MMFTSSKPETSNDDNAFKRYMNERPTNVADGLFKGVLSVGNGLFQGITGVFIEPVRHAKKDGAMGFVRGVGKGLTGIVLKPVAGVIDLAGKTTQGIINTPITVYEAIKQANKEQEQIHKMIPTTTKGKIFGIPIEESFAYCVHANITHLTTETIRYLVNCVEDEGLFRISGNTLIVAELRNKFDKGENVVLTKGGDTNYSSSEVAGVLKLYLRCLPEPLLTFERYAAFLYIHQNEKDMSERLRGHRDLINTLPPANMILLIQLMKLLKLVANHADKNLMKSSNLATVFGPALLRSRDTDLSDSKLMEKNAHQTFMEVGLSIGVVFEIIEYYDYIFGDVVV